MTANNAKLRNQRKRRFFRKGRKVRFSIRTGRIFEGAQTTFSQKWKSALRENAVDHRSLGITERERRRKSGKIDAENDEKNEKAGEASDAREHINH